MKEKFNHYDLSICQPEFSAPLTGLILELDHLKKRRLRGTTYPPIFFQLKTIFHMFESIGSARIEGNRTTIIEFIENKIEKSSSPDEKITEIKNMEKALDFIDDNIDHLPINSAFISELHKIVVTGLSSDKEGDVTPGAYRKKNVKITYSSHVPPDALQVEYYMDELFKFINKADPAQFDLLKTAIAHHRFVWIHPFTNGNGRTVRLFTYAMLVKQGFNVHIGKIVNPTAVFCNDRDKYYNYLASADSGKTQDILAWCEYVLSGLKNEIEKIDHLLDYNYLQNEILLPALDFALTQKYITPQEQAILNIAVEKQIFQAGDIKKIFPGKVPAEISRNIRKIKEKGLIMPIKDDSRKYTIAFNNNYLLRAVVKMLGDRNFISLKE